MRLLGRLGRKERPHPGAQLRFTDRDELRLTAFVTNATRGQLPDLELRKRSFQSFDANRIWLAVVTLAMDLTAWMQTLARHDHDACRPLTRLDSFRRLLMTTCASGFAASSTGYAKTTPRPSILLSRRPCPTISSRRSILP